MPTPEEIVARRKAEEAKRTASAFAAQLERHSAEVKRLVPLAIETLEEKQFPCHQDYGIVWEGRDRIAWHLCGNRGGADYETQVYLLADGTLLITRDNRKTFRVLEPPYQVGLSFDDAKMVDSLVKLAGKRAHKRHKFLGLL